MKKNFVLLLIILLISSTLMCDGGLRNLQSVCKITLKDGRVIDGFIVLAKGTFARYYHKNGFYWEAEGYRRKEMFHYDSERFDLLTGRVQEWNGGYEPEHIPEDVRVYFWEDITPERDARGHNHKETIETRSSLDIIQREVSYHYAFRLLDYIPFYKRLPESLDLTRGNPYDFEPFYLNWIESVELVREPSKEILDKINEYERNLEEKINPHLDPFPPPSWFHVIIKDKRYKEFFWDWNLD